MRLSVRARAKDERGVTLILMTLLLVILLGIAGLVVNLGLVRADRQRNKSSADVAVSAGLKAADVGGGNIGTASAACAAKTYLQANHPELGTFTTATWTNASTPPASFSDPCAAPVMVCNSHDSASARSTFTWFHGVTSTGLTVDIKAGYDATDMVADGFGDESYHTDTGAADQFGCDQLAVTVREEEDAGFGKVLGAGTLASTIRSVGRLTIQDASDDAVALLLLEREECKALNIGGTTTFVRVEGLGIRPGMIHSDSMATHSCTGSNKVFMGHHASGIMARRAPSGTATGIISMAALGGANPSEAYDSASNVVAEGGAPTAGNVKGRGPVDNRYLGLADGSTPAYGITKLRADASAAFAYANAPAASAAGYTTYTGGACPPSSIPAGVTKIWLNCSVTTNWSVPATVEDIVITGVISLNGATVTIPNPRTLYVKGSTAPNGSGIELKSGGNLIVNTNNITVPVSPATTICGTRRNAAPTATTKLVIGNGNLKGGSDGTLRMCSSTVFMMDGILPTASGTAPANNGFNGGVSVTAQSTLEWTAPNQNNSGPPTDAQLKQLEDLALWTESSGGNSIGGTNASITLKGVLFTPNANAFNLNSGNGGITADAQFITRKLDVSGGAVLTMTADPNNSIPFTFVSNFSLVR